MYMVILASKIIDRNRCTQTGNMRIERKEGSDSYEIPINFNYWCQSVEYPLMLIVLWTLYTSAGCPCVKYLLKIRLKWRAGHVAKCKHIAG